MSTPRRRLIGVLVLPLLAACGSATSEISPDDVKPPAAVNPNACTVVPDSAVAPAVAAPTAAELPASSPAAGPSNAPAAPPGVYVVTAVGSHPNVGQCTYRSALGPTLVVSVYPKSTLSGLADVTTGLRPLGPTLVSGTDNDGLLAFQDGAAVVGLALAAGGLNQSALVRRLGTVYVAATGQPLTLPALSASAATSTGAAVPTPLPAAGAPVNGQTASQTVQETGSLKFDPASTTVSVGGVVLWTNTSSVQHNVTFDANPELTSQTMSSGDKFELKFTRAGQYAYHCTFHPGMDGTVTVS
ncbi:MAG TPA: plastocyanin/azurin family copper-binding protein [Candidatus Dormibacteraeota bacterium]